jgi:predicted nucleic acid-binding protein
VIVIDASVAVKWVVVEAEHDIALSLARSEVEFAAPSILVPELINVLRKKVLRKEMAAEQARRAVVKATGLIRNFVEIHDRTAEIMDMSLALNHPAYDCCYIAVADRLKAALVTADRSLEQKARQFGVETYGLGAWIQAGG